MILYLYIYIYIWGVRDVSICVCLSPGIWVCEGVCVCLASRSVGMSVAWEARRARAMRRERAMDTTAQRDSLDPASLTRITLS